MSDTRNHTTRDQLAEALYFVLVDHHVWIGDDGQPLDYSPEREARLGDLIHDLTDALEPVIAAVRAAAVAETTAAIEALADLWAGSDPDREFILGDEYAAEIREVLSGGRTALDTTLAQAWDQGATHASPHGGGYLRSLLIENPYRADTGADQ